ncbi:hypothetical protein SAMN05444285_1702 [Draconibacterium orientale]|jgi:hypothetical protein|uniref:Uncharacterized protein n=1 Tax=Draconibacterium orientale TaxID=1168034 RepID=A0A1I0JZE8_9BACT|nr:hypothetical protein SAMN05444285_1702 [Draconibacterium orientale]
MLYLFVPDVKYGIWLWPIFNSQAQLSAFSLKKGKWFLGLADMRFDSVAEICYS